MIPSPPYANVTHQSQASLWWEGTLTLPTFLEACPIHFTWTWTLCQGHTSSTQFPLDRLCVCQVIHFSRTEVLLPCEGGKRGWTCTPIFQRFCGRVQRMNTTFLIQCFLSVLTLAPPPHLEEGIQMEGRSGDHSASTQMKGESGYHPALKHLQDVNQARAQLEYELVQEIWELADRHKHMWAKQTRRHARQWAEMINQTDATFQEVFSQACLTDAVKLLLWCVSAAVPFCYISGAITIAAQQDEGIPTIFKPCPTASEPEPHGSLAQGPSAGLTPPLGTTPLPVSSLPLIHWQALLWWGTLFLTS